MVKQNKISYVKKSKKRKLSCVKIEENKILFVMKRKLKIVGYCNIRSCAIKITAIAHHLFPPRVGRRRSLALWVRDMLPGVREPPL